MTLRRAALALLALAASPAHAGLATAIEFYNASLRHYFLTANPAEAAMLDAGTTVKGWKRTGGQFTVFTEPAEGLSAVCRFFGTPNVGPNSHFYTADAAECAKVKTLPAWTFEEVSFYIPMPANGSCGGNWPVYRSYYSDNISDANHRFTQDLTAHVRMPQRRGDVLEGIVMCAPVTDEEREADVVRFLEQATLGPTEALVAEVKAKGIEAWLDEQLPMNVTRYTQHPFFDVPADPLACIDDTTQPITPEKFCQVNKVSQMPAAWEFFRQARTAPDQLRMRMAHVWHQIFVAVGNVTYSHFDYHQRLRDNAFATFETLLRTYTLSPQLGMFQNWVNNVPERNGVKPNENFARELMQLFTTGVNELNDDGTLKLGASGKPIPTYTQADIETLARVLTGFAFAPRPGEPARMFAPYYFFGDMVPYEEWHDTGAKYALGGRIALPAGGGALAEVRAALKALVDHPNTPPFIAKQLIQKTVTSSPTPAYVGRVAAAFRNNGRGVRGDLAAVTKAILLDPEARGARKIDAEYGRMREPALYLSGMVRALDIQTDGVVPFELTAVSNQIMFIPESVFSYYPADYTIAGAIPAPEFGIYGSTEFLNRINHAVSLLDIVDIPHVREAWSGPRPYVPDALGTSQPTLAAFLDDAASPDAIVDRVDRLFMHRAMTPEMRKIIVTAVGKVPASDRLSRVRLTLRLVLTSVDYHVQK